MGLFDNNIHMNGAGTTYQAFLNLADAAEEKGGRIGDRTVRLVKAGDGLATTTSRATKGARADQIADARNAFLLAIAREFGYAARNIAEKTLGAGENAVPLTARTIRAVNQALGDKNALAADSALIRENKADFDIEVGAARQQLQSRMGAADADFDRAKIQAEVLKLVKDGKYPSTKDGMRAAIREVAAMRVAVAARMESLLRARGVPAHLAPGLAARVLDQAAAIVDDYTIPAGEAVTARLNDLATKAATENQDFFAQYAIAEATVSDAEKLLTTMFGPDALKDEDAKKALDTLKSRIDKLKDENLKTAAFEAECDKAAKLTVKSYILRQIGVEMMLDDSDNPSYGRSGVRLYDALGVGKGPKDRAVDDYHFWKMPSASLVTRFGLDGNSPEELRRVASKMVFGAIAEDYADKLPPLRDAHPHLATVRTGVVYKVAEGFVDRFSTAVTDEDFAKLAEDFKTQLAGQLDRTNTTLKNIDLAADRAKGELEGRFEQLAGQLGIPLTQGIRDMLSKTLAEATEKLKQAAPAVDKALSADECRAAILDRIEEKWLGPCRQAAAEIGASALAPAQKKAFLAKVVEGKVEVAHVRMALRTVAAFDAGELVAAAKAGDGRKLAEQFFQFVARTNAAITDKAELKSIEGADDYAAFVATAADLLFVLNPGIGEGVRGLDAGPRAKTFDDAVQTSSDKSREIQNQNRDGLDKAQEMALALEAKHWSSATSCAMQLQQATAVGV